MGKIARSSKVHWDVLSGMNYRVHPSEAYQGIEDGVVIVTAIYQVKGTQQIDNLRVLHSFQDWIELYGLEGTEDAIVTEIVEYVYPGKEEKYYLQLEDFVAHATVY